MEKFKSIVKIMCYYPNSLDSTSFHRGQGVMAELCKHDNIEINSHSKSNWAILKGYDIVFFQRPFTPQHVDLIYNAKIFNRKIWIDFDDLLTDIPKGNDVLKRFDQENVTASVLEAISYADIVTVSTSFLKTKLIEEFNNFYKGKPPRNCPKFIVIPNAFDDYYMSIKDTNFIRENSRQKLIVWRGSDSHKNDLIAYEEQIIKSIEKLKDFQWIFIGYNPKFITNKYKNVKHQQALDIGMYYQYFKFINPLAFITPLEDNGLNRAKSNLTSIESAYAGAACIAPNWEEWQDGYNILYDSNISLYDRICEVSENCDKIKDIARLNWEHVMQNRLLSNVNKMRVEVVKNLMDI